MNLQEILTYVEELTFKNSMFGGYDKDEVDIQLDKICDEVEALVTQKDKEIDSLRGKLNAMIEHSDISKEDLAGMFASEVPAEDMVSRDEYDAVLDECAQLKTALEKAQREAEAQAQAAAEAAEAAPAPAQSDDEAVRLLVGEIDAAKGRAALAEEARDEALAELEALKAELAEATKALEEAQAAAPVEETENIEEVIEEAAEEVAVAEEVPAAPANTEEAYNQYMKFADLLCKQLAEVETKHAKIVEEATAEAVQIREAAQSVYDERNTEATEQAQLIIENAKNEAEGIVENAKAEAEDMIEEAKAKVAGIDKEYEEKSAEAQAQCQEIIDKKDALVASLSGFGEEIAALVAKMQ